MSADRRLSRERPSGARRPSRERRLTAERRPGRHEKPSAERDAALRRAVVDGRVAVAVLSGVTGVLTVVVVAIATGGSAERTTGRAAAVQATSASPHATTSPHEDATGDAEDEPGAVAYLHERDKQDTVVKHVKDVRWSGRYLRVYTDLKEVDTDSKVALDLCEWTSEYLADRQGDRNPVVFVHAKRNGNGNVVLVNKLSAKDACKSVETL
jgi:hypothetical protein